MNQFLSQSPSKDDVAKLTTGIPVSAKDRTGFAGGLLALLNDISVSVVCVCVCVCLCVCVCMYLSVYCVCVCVCVIVQLKLM